MCFKRKCPKCKKRNIISRIIYDSFNDRIKEYYLCKRCGFTSKRKSDME